MVHEAARTRITRAVSSKSEHCDNNILQAAVMLGSYLETSKFSYCLIEGVAHQRWGEPRQTADVDAVLFTDFGNETQFAELLIEQFASRIENPLPFAIQNRIVLLETEDGIGIDISFGGMPYERDMIARASDWDIPGHGMLRTCSAEDLVVLKSFASRPQDWIDVEKVIIRQGAKLDRELISKELQPLVDLKEEPEIMDRLMKLFAKHLPS